MVDPVAHRRLSAGQIARATIHEPAERHLGLVIASVPHHKEHGHIERPFGVIREAEIVRIGDGQNTRALTVDVAPHLGAERQEAVGLGFGEGRVGEQGGGDRLKLETDLHLLAHVGLGREIEIDLNGGRAVHHVEPIAARLGDAAPHDVVARARHTRCVGERAQRRGT